jgi:hypothetical protein
MAFVCFVRFVCFVAGRLQRAAACALLRLFPLSAFSPARLAVCSFLTSLAAEAIAS